MMSIQLWPTTERPREKLIHKGAKALSDAELLAIFLRTGTQGKTAVDLARQLLKQSGSLSHLLNIPLHEFCQIRGLGSAKYVQLQACIELAQRYVKEELQQRNIMKDPADVHHFLVHKLRHQTKEVFVCLFMDKKNQLLMDEEVAHGTIDQSHIYPRELVKQALQCHASNVILCHNHPSGNPQPSQDDIRLTQHLQKALKLIDVQVLDHVIVGGKQVFSFLQQGLL